MSQIAEDHNGSTQAQSIMQQPQTVCTAAHLNPSKPNPRPSFPNVGVPRQPAGQTALHWAAVRGALSATETILRCGANLRQQDSRGYTICHVAAQYGQTAILYHVAMRWGADVDAPDNDGRTPLHWAAYKGFTDTIRLLLVMDARYNLPDKEGCTPLHWAAIRGNGEACIVLLQACFKLQSLESCPSCQKQTSPESLPRIWKCRHFWGAE